MFKLKCSKTLVYSKQMQPLFDQNDDSCFYEDYKAIIDDLIEKKKKASE